MIIDKSQDNVWLCRDEAKRVLVVDDDEQSRRLLEALLQSEGFEILLAETGDMALTLVKTFKPHLILLDLMMPGMTGFEVVKRLKNDPDTHAIPVIVVSALDNRDSRLEGLRAGAEDFLTKPIDPVELRIRARNLLRLKDLNDWLEGHNQILENRVKDRTRELHESFVESIDTLIRAAEFRDDETGDHVRRISYYSRELASQLGMDKTFCDLIFHASPMHDIGKIGIPDHILLKPGGFEAAEWVVMKSHTTIGAQILANNSSPYLKIGYDIALGHHERWDGSGYPYGRQGEEIPLAARIMQLADVYDALRSSRPYKSSFDHARSLVVILQGDGRTMPFHFDPAVLEAFRQCATTCAEIFTHFCAASPVVQGVDVERGRQRRPFC